MLLYNFRKKMSLFEDNQKERPSQARPLKHEAQYMLDEKSMHSILPGLHDFPFMVRTSVLDVYKMNNIEPVHQLNLCLSKMSNNCALKMLRSCNIKTTSFYTPGPRARTLHSILRGVNTTVEQICRLHGDDQ